MTTSSAVDVVVVSYRCWDVLRSCLKALEDHAPEERELRIHVVDNASGDATAGRVKAEFPHVNLYALDRNLGFAAATNLAIRGSDAPYVLALNPDTRVTPGALDRLLDLMDEREDIGIAGCRLVRGDGTLDHAAKRSFPTVVSAFGHLTWLGRRNGARGPLAEYRAPEVERGPVDAVSGAFMLIRREALEDVGLFDEGYWMYMEDLDLCYRFAEAGWTTWYEPGVTVVHLKGGSTGAYRPPRLNYAFHYGMYRFYRDHYAPERGALERAGVYAAIAAHLGLSMTGNGVRALLGGSKRSAAAPAPAQGLDERKLENLVAVD